MSHNGGPAFPGEGPAYPGAGSAAGISALDLFAAFAMVGQLMTPGQRLRRYAEEAAEAYDLAEAMLTERELRALRAKEGA